LIVEEKNEVIQNRQMPKQKLRGRKISTFLKQESFLVNNDDHNSDPNPNSNPDPSNNDNLKKDNDSNDKDDDSDNNNNEVTDLQKIGGEMGEGVIRKEGRVPGLNLSSTTIPNPNPNGHRSSHSNPDPIPSPNPKPNRNPDPNPNLNKRVKEKKLDKKIMEEQEEEFLTPAGRPRSWSLNLPQVEKGLS
jgi:hypothetical protein